MVRSRSERCFHIRGEGVVLVGVDPLAPVREVRLKEAADAVVSVAGLVAVFVLQNPGLAQPVVKRRRLPRVADPAGCRQYDFRG